MTKQQFLKRCETIYEMGLADKETLRLLERWVDFVMRLEGGQMYDVARFFEKEQKRLPHFSSGQVLANDVEGYKIIQLAAILTHPCQECAEDPKAWHTRSAFCEHKEK